jgi:hypothetical protein
VSPDGNDHFPGTIDQPFRTIQHAADMMKPGDKCLIRQGLYHETVVIKEQEAGGGKSLEFKAYDGERVILDGTQPILTRWERYRDHIYKTRVDMDVWQLFVDGKMMISARWPNGYFHDQSIWNRETSWERVDPRSQYGLMYSEGIAETGIDFTAAIGVIQPGESGVSLL